MNPRRQSLNQKSAENAQQLDAGKAAYTIFLVVGMMCTGTVSTLMNKWQDKQCVENCDAPADHQKLFEQPVWQTMIMFVGEFLCFAVYGVGILLSNQGWWNFSGLRASSSSCADETAFVGNGDDEERQRLLTGDDDGDDDVDFDQGSAADDELLLSSMEKRPLDGWHRLWLALPAACDITATTMMNVGLMAVSASVYQMLRGSVVLWTGFLSFALLKIRLPAYKIYAMFMVLLGIVIVGASPIFFADKEEESTDKKLSPLLGVVLIFTAQIFSALQFVVEEKVLRKYSVEPVIMVGLEGLFGMILVTLGMVVLYPLVGHDTGNLLDVLEGWHQIINNPILWGSSLGSCIAIGAFNYFGLNITRVISATSRTTIDTCRTLFVWAISLSLAWEAFLWLQVVGFLVLIYGTFVFNRVIGIIPFITKPVSA